MDGALALLSAWMPQQRWYAAKGRTPSLRLIGAFELPATGGSGAVVRTLLIADDAGDESKVYQVPVVVRATASVDEPVDHVIGSPEPGITLVDAPFDPVFAEALLRLATADVRADGDRAAAVGRPVETLAETSFDATVLSGEQSNTSIVYRPAGAGDPVIVKLYRQLNPGLNPDIELQSALAAAGSPFVPRTVGFVEGTWRDGSAPATGSLAFAQQFLPGVEDAWRVALHAAAAGDDFTARARDLGAATASVHVALAELFETREATEADREATIDGWRRRLATATADVPELAALRPRIEAVYARTADAVWPPLQRVHGDYHLGQVILVPGHGWMLLDFEGEPLRPIEERRLPDLALRDVAGMVRSIDYVAGSIGLEGHTPDAVRRWSRATRRAFLAGYAAASGVDLVANGALLDALELDKALYEAVYEFRNRPGWLPIPLQAIARLVGA